MIDLCLANDADLRWAQEMVENYHYLHTPVDDRCSPLAYIVTHQAKRVGCLIFGRPEATCCYDTSSRLTFGSFEDVQAGRCHYDRWELINLARVWLDPSIQFTGEHYVRHAASTAIKAALVHIGYDYLRAHLPVDCARPYQLRVCLSYNDTKTHTGYLYRACRFKLARTNRDGIQTFFKSLVGLTLHQDVHIQRLSEQAPRSRVLRSRRLVTMQQLPLEMAPC